MTANKESFDEMFSGLREMLGQTTNSKPIPQWVKYVEVKAGDNLDDIIPTAFQMHAAILGKKLEKRIFYYPKIITYNNDFLGDLSSKIPCVYEDAHNRYYLLNDEIFIKDNLYLQSERDSILEIFSLDINLFNYIENLIKFYTDSNEQVATV